MTTVTDRKGFEFNVLSEDIIEGGYPRLNDAGNVVYVLEPVFCTNKDTGVEGWFLVRLAKGGYLQPDLQDCAIEYEPKAKKYVDHLNGFNGFTPEEVLRVTRWSKASKPEHVPVA